MASRKKEFVTPITQKPSRVNPNLSRTGKREDIAAGRRGYIARVEAISGKEAADKLRVLLAELEAQGI